MTVCGLVHITRHTLYIYYFAFHRSREDNISKHISSLVDPLTFIWIFWALRANNWHLPLISDKPLHLHWTAEPLHFQILCLSTSFSKKNFGTTRSSALNCRAPSLPDIVFIYLMFKRFCCTTRASRCTTSVIHGTSSVSYGTSELLHQ